MPAAVEENGSNSAEAANNTTDSNEDTETLDRDQQMAKVLKAYILRDRARKKQEREAEVEEERLRKEREARERQNVMTLGETRDQILHLEAKLQQFKEEKHQLFLRLKKVLNDDDNRRRQLVKEATDQMIPILSIPREIPQNQQQALYIQQSQVPNRIQTISQQPPAPQQTPTYKTALKRPRSPSPPTQVPVSLYHQGYTTYKTPTVATSYQGSPQNKDDGRRNELVRAVLWNKAPQYSNQPSAFFPVAPQDIPIYYSGISREVYETQLGHKLPEHYSALRTATTQHGHVIHPGTGLTINPGQPSVKGGSITAGYPVRTQTQYQQAAPASLYTTQSRQIYQNYPPRE